METTQSKRERAFTPREIPVETRGTLRGIRTRKFKSNLFSFVTVMPITRENAVMAPLLLSVLRRGTERYPGLAEINRRLDDLYGASLWSNSHYRGNRLLVGFGMELLDESYLPEPANLTEGVREVMEQILFHPLTDGEGLLLEKYVTQEKDLQCDEIRSLRNEPARYASAQARRLFYAGTPGGIPIYGTEEEVRAVTPRMLTDYWKQWLDAFVPNAFYVGSDPASAKRLMNGLFGGLGGGGGTPITGLSDEPPQATARSVTRKDEDFPASQSHLILCFRTGGVCVGHPDEIALRVAVELLGASPISLLFMNVREKHSLCYSIYASFDAFRAGMFVKCSLSRKNREIAEAEILEQVETVREGRFTDEQLDAARKSLGGAYRQLEDRPTLLKTYWTGRLLAGVRQSPEEVGKRISEVTREDVVRAAKRLSLDTVYFLQGTKPEEVPDEAEEV